MKNFQQTPKQRRIKVTKAKHLFSATRNQCFQPQPKNGYFTEKRKVNGVSLDVLNRKQEGAGYPGANQTYTYIGFGSYYRF